MVIASRLRGFETPLRGEFRSDYLPNEELPIFRLVDHFLGVQTRN